MLSVELWPTVQSLMHARTSVSSLRDGPKEFSDLIFSPRRNNVRAVLVRECSSCTSVASAQPRKSVSWELPSVYLVGLEVRHSVTATITSIDARVQKAARFGTHDLKLCLIRILKLNF